MLFYIGCYTAAAGGDGAGIVPVRADAGGALTQVGPPTRTPAPSFLARHPRLPVLYAVQELDAGAVSAFAVEKNGRLRHLATRATGGAAPCHLAVWPDGRHLVTVNYGSGSVVVHPLDAVGVPGERTHLVQHVGRGPHPQRQRAPHPHMAAPEPDGVHLRVVDLGTDMIRRYALDSAAGRLRLAGPTVSARPGSGPRHLVRGPGGRCYVTGELDGTVMAYRAGTGGEWCEAATVPSSAMRGPASPSELALGPGGRFLYVANRGPSTIAVFDVADEVPRIVTEVGAGGLGPRHFAIREDLIYVANERSHEIVTLRIDLVTGVPRHVGVALQTPSPTCVLPPN